MAEKHTGSPEEAPITLEEAMDRLQEQNAALRRALHRERLMANGFRSDGFATRRQLYEDLRGTHPDFAPDYQPTMAEIYSKTVGGENWDAVWTGAIVEMPDPWGTETPEITAWQDSEYEIFVRKPEDASREPHLRSADEILSSIHQEFPNV
jgi:hypothetical protein